MKALAARRHHRSAPVVLLLLALLVTGGLYAALAPSPAGAAEASESDIETGSELFQANCATCHGMNAEGTQDAPVPHRRGRGVGRLPGRHGPDADAVQRPAGDGQAAAVHRRAGRRDWRRTSPRSARARRSRRRSRSTRPRATSPNGMQIFRTNCAMCHNAVGAGGALIRGQVRAVPRRQHRRRSSTRPWSPARSRCRSSTTPTSPPRRSATSSPTSSPSATAAPAVPSSARWAR